MKSKVKIRLYPQISKFSGCSIFFFINLFNAYEFFFASSFHLLSTGNASLYSRPIQGNLHVLVGAEAEILRGG